MRRKLNSHAALRSPTKDDLRNGPSRDKLPEKVRRMSKSETACGICGVSYLVFSEVKELESQLKDARQELAAEKAQAGERGRLVFSEVKQLESQLKAAKQELEKAQAGERGRCAASTDDGVELKRLQREIAALKDASKRALAVRDQDSADAEQRLARELSEQQQAHEAALVAAAADATAVAEQQQQRLQHERQLRHRSAGLLGECQLQLGHARTSLRQEQAALQLLRREFEDGRAQAMACLQDMAAQLLAKVRAQSDKARAEARAHEMAAVTATIALAAEQREVESLRLQLSQQVGAAQSSKGDLSRQLAAQGVQVEASREEAACARRDAAQLAQQCEAQEAASAAAVADLKQRLQLQENLCRAADEQLVARANKLQRCEEAAEASEAGARAARALSVEMSAALEGQKAKTEGLATRLRAAEEERDSVDVQLRELRCAQASAEGRAGIALRESKALRAQLDDLEKCSAGTRSETEAECQRLRAALQAATEAAECQARDDAASKSAAQAQLHDDIQAERTAHCARVAEAQAAQRKAADQQQRTAQAELVAQRKELAAQAAAAAAVAEREVSKVLTALRRAAAEQTSAAQRWEQQHKHTTARVQELETQLSQVREGADRAGQERARANAQCASLRSQVEDAKASLAQAGRQAADKENEDACVERLEGTLIKLTSLCREKDAQIRRLQGTVQKECAERTRILSELAASRVQQHR
jgi:hypothetical protein